MESVYTMDSQQCVAWDGFSKVVIPKATEQWTLCLVFAIEEIA